VSWIQFLFPLPPLQFCGFQSFEIFSKIFKPFFTNLHLKQQKVPIFSNSFLLPQCENLPEKKKTLETTQS
jgi:hypothetical protein